MSACAHALVRVAFLGLGNMGAGMAASIARAGYPLAVWTRDSDKASAFAAASSYGAPVRAARSPRDAVRDAQIVCMCLATPALSLSTLLGDEGDAGGGVLAALRGTRAIVIDHATVDAATTERCARAADEHGVRFLDAPVSGGAAGAAAGTLSIMVGGAAADFDEALPVLRSMSRTCLRMGGCGAGTAAKLVNQLLVAAHTAAAAEACALADAAGLPGGALLELLRDSWGNSVVLQRCGQIMLGEAAAQGRTVAELHPNSAVPLRNLAKDAHIIAETGRSLGVRLLLLARTCELIDDATRAGLGSADIAVLFDSARARQPPTQQQQQQQQQQQSD